jgi:hypothetical protein
LVWGVAAFVGGGMGHLSFHGCPIYDQHEVARWDNGLHLNPAKGIRVARRNLPQGRLCARGEVLDALQQAMGYWPDGKHKTLMAIPAFYSCDPCSCDGWTDEECYDYKAKQAREEQQGRNKAAQTLDMAKKYGICREGVTR